MSEDLAAIAYYSIKASDSYRGNHPALGTVSFVVVVGVDGHTVVHPYSGDALMKLIGDGAPMHEAWSTRDL